MASILFTNPFFVYCVRKKQTAKKCVLAKSRMKKKTMEWWINRMYTPLHLAEDHPWHGHRPWGAPGWSWCHRRRLDSTVLNQEKINFIQLIQLKVLASSFSWCSRKLVNFVIAGIHRKIISFNVFICLKSLVRMMKVISRFIRRIVEWVLLIKTS